MAKNPNHSHKMKKWRGNTALLISALIAISLAVFLLWVSSLSLPDFNTIYERRVAQSTKIYDRTGKILLYNVYKNKQRTAVSGADISPFIKNATIAIEDSEFYQHHGIRPTSIIRAFLANIKAGDEVQGGSTITQQVIKNALLSNEKTLTRKIKEAILALKIERVMTKDEILTIYLNESPYGGSLYGIEEASLSYFGKEAKDVTLAQAAYLAALPQAPSRYSPYGNNKEDLEKRKDVVLDRMAELNFITKEEAVSAKKEKVVFLPQSERGIRAPHFVMYIRGQLEEKYGADAIETQGFKVITTIDATMQEKAEKVVSDYGKTNERDFNAKNAGLVAIDPKTGDILAMVGSRNYFDFENEGNFNITLAKRQPGSAFKPFVYATLFKKGYTDSTVLFDVPTQFSTTCDAYGNGTGCYMPQNFDDNFRGPMTIREALAQSINIPAVKSLYLAGIDNSIETARDMGITTLTNSSRYGLTLVLGGGEVELLEMTNAYGVFAQDGTYNPHRGILSIEDSKGKSVYKSELSPRQALDTNIARTITSILSDNNARIPTYGANSPLLFTDREVAAKTGTTDNYRDVWVIGYAPNIVVGAWAGNNDNTPIAKKIAGLVIVPLWRAYMNAVLPELPNESFNRPEIGDTSSLKPVFRGSWQGGVSQTIDKTTGLPATELTLPENKEERLVSEVHSILYWVNKNDPLGPAPSNPDNDSQFNLWETPVRAWALSHGYQ